MTIKIRRPRRFASLVGLSVVLTLMPGAFTPASSIEPNHVTLTFTGCRGSFGGSFPITGPFVCSDGEYTTGNLGGGWNELDLVPYRLITSLGSQTAATTTYDLRITADHKNKGATGYDFISIPVVNTGKSHGSCGISVTDASQALQKTADESLIYRNVRITQNKGTTCTFDYYERLALGSSLYPGSALHSHTRNETGGTAGVGNRDVPIPVAAIQPQQVSKDMEATQGSNTVWTVSKEASPATRTFTNTCDTTAATSQAVTVTVTWTKTTTASGDITITTVATVTNPAHRPLLASLEDKTYKGTGQNPADLVLTSTLADAVGGPFADPFTLNPGTVSFTWIKTLPAGTASVFNDVLTVTYTDPVPGNQDVVIPSKQATDSDTVEILPPTSGATATLSDVETMTGTGLSFRITSVTGSGAPGSFVGGYTPGAAAPLVTSATWNSGTLSAGGSVTFNKEVHVAAPIITSGTLSDTATLSPAGQAQKTANASVSISASAVVALTINKSIPNVLQGSESQTFQFRVFNSSDVQVAAPTITFTAGQTAKNVQVTGLPPDVYTVKEDTAPGWNPQADQTADLRLPNCSGSVSFANTFGPATAQVRKVTDPAGQEANWTFTLSGPGVPTAPPLTVTTSGTGFATFPFSLQEGTYTVTETLKSGWEQGAVSLHKVNANTTVAQTTTCSFTVSYPADNDEIFQCTFNNTELARLTVNKTVSGVTPPSTATFDFKLTGGPSPGVNITKTAQQSNGWSVSFEDLRPSPPNYTLCELAVPAGWTVTFKQGATTLLTQTNATTGDVCISLALGPGADVTIDVDDVPPPGGDARTPGYWKNWNRCTGGGQARTADANGFDILEDFLPQTIGILSVADCPTGVHILNRQDVVTATKRSNDAAYGLASHLLAAKLNVAAGAGVCVAATTAMADAQTLLASISFNGTGSYLPSKVSGSLKVLRNQANSLRNTLDRYNNNLLCP